MQVLHAGVYEVEDTDEVHIDRVDERLRWKARGQRTDAGIGHHDVEMAELGYTSIDRRGQRRAVTDVGDLGVRALALLLDQPGCLVEVLGPRERILVGLDVFADVDGDDVGALGGKHPCV